MKLFSHDFYRLVIDFLYPNACPCCDKYIGYNDAFCESCTKKIKEFHGDFSITNVDRALACCEYAEPMRSVVLQLKKTNQSNAYYAFAFYIMKKISEYELADSIDLITAVPVSKRTLRRERGYNQSELIAKELRFMLDKPYENVLRKVRETAQQKTLDGEERKKNVIGAYDMNKKASVEGKRILLIDDVCTTGSTLSEAAKILKENGASCVIAAVFAKTVRN